MSVVSAVRRAAASLHTHFSLFGARGVLKRVLLGLTGSLDRRFSASIPNSTKNIILRLGTTDVAAFEHVFVEDEYKFWLARQPSTIIDAGANVGMSAVYFALRYPGAKIVAIEPEPTNFDVLTSNAKLFPQIIPINAALWNREGVVQIEDGGGGNWGMRVADTNIPSEIAVRSTTLASLLEQLNLDHVDLLKIDVEGAECEIFETRRNGSVASV